MITTIQSSITTVNVERLRSNLQALGLTVLEIRPARLVEGDITLTEVDLDGEVLGELLDLAQSCVDSGAIDLDDTKLRKSGGDFKTFVEKSSSKKLDLILIEDSDNLFGKRKLKIGSILHSDLSNSGQKSHSEIDQHLNSSANPHSVTKSQVGLGEVENKQQIKRESDFSTFPQKEDVVGDDLLLIEDSENSNSKKFIKISDLPVSKNHVCSFNGRKGAVVSESGDYRWDQLDLSESSIEDLVDRSHHRLTDRGQFTHEQLDLHILQEDNPHNVTAAQIGLSDVTNDAQVKRVSDFSTFPTKQKVDKNDLIIIEDSKDNFNKKSLSIHNLLPTGAVIPFAGDVAPNGWFLCDGSCLTISTNQELFDVIGDKHNNGSEPPGMFRLPNTKQRFILGKADEGTGSEIGELGGTIDHRHTGGPHKHFVAPHEHAVPPHHHGLGAGADMSIAYSGAHEHNYHFELGEILPGEKKIIIQTDQQSEQFSGQHKHPPSSFSGRLGNVLSQNDGDAGFDTNAVICETDTGGQVATTSNNPPYIVFNCIIKG